MLNFNISYKHEIEDYFDPFNPELEDYYVFEKGYFDEIFFYDEIATLEEDEKWISAINDFRRIVKRDMQDIIALRVNSLNNNAKLLNELYTVIDTIDNGIDFDFTYAHKNFAFRTDNYLCFNNYENYVDELLLGSLDNDACIYETIVIIDARIMNFYFIRTKKNMCYDAPSTTINAYQVKDKNVKQRKVNFKHGLTLTEHNDEGIKKMLSLVS